MNEIENQASYDYSKQERYFTSLCEKLGLVIDTNNTSSESGLLSAAQGFVRVHFENDRGLCNLAIGPATDEKPLCGVEELASRFPRIRAMPGGLQRLSLEEQSHFVTKHWEGIQVMFSPDHVSETKRWRRAAVEAYTKRFTGGS